MSQRLDEPSVSQLLMLGVGTVFGTLGAVVLLLFVLALLSSTGSFSAGEFKQLFLGLLLYGFFGAVLASVICAITAFPLVVSFRVLFRLLRRRGVDSRHSAMITAGCLSLFGTILIIGAAVFVKAMYFPLAFWPTVLIPVAIATFLSCDLFYEQESTAL